MKRYLIVAAAAFLVFGYSIGFDFVFYDDKDLILDNTAILSNWSNIGQAFLHSIWPSYVSIAHYYRPIELITWIADFHIADIHPWIYHFSNVLYHALATMAFYALLGSLGTHSLWRLPLAIAYAAHPVMASAVAWIPGRNDSLLAIFTFLSLIFTLKSLSSNRIRDLFLFTVCLLLALFTKESAVVLPVLVYLLIRGHPKKERATLLIALSAVSLFAYFVMRQAAAPGGQDSAFSSGFFSLIVMLISSAPAFLCYLGKVFFPFHTQVMPTFSWLDFSIGLAALVAVARLVILNSERNMAKITFAAAMFFLFLAPSLHHAPDVKLSAFFLLEHRMAVPLAGALMIVPQLISTERLLANEPLFHRLSIVTLLMIAFVSVMSQTPYRDRMSFWKAAVRSNDLAFPRLHLGDMYYYDSDFAAAKKWYEEAMALNPKEYLVNNNLGVYYLSQNQLDLAEKHFKAELENFPSSSRALVNLAIIANRQGKKADAEQRYLRLLSYYPDFIEAYRQLTVLYIDMKKPDEAEKVIGILQRKGDSVPDYIFEEIAALKKANR